jgi:hypothetical protein
MVWHGLAFDYLIKQKKTFLKNGKESIEDDSCSAHPIKGII